jgi:hypothetical protein
VDCGALGLEEACANAKVLKINIEPQQESAPRRWAFARRDFFMQCIESFILIKS